VQFDQGLLLHSVLLVLGSANLEGFVFSKRWAWAKDGRR
jgi:hypothetical protein